MINQLKGKLIKWWFDVITCWQNGKLTKWQSDSKTIWHNDMLTKWNVDKMTIWHNDMLTKWNVDILTSCLIEQWTKDPVNKTSWLNIKLIKWQINQRHFDQLTCWQNDNWLNGKLTNCLSTIDKGVLEGFLRRRLDMEGNFRSKFRPNVRFLKEKIILKFENWKPVACTINVLRS